MEDRSIEREWKKGSAELLLLSLLEALPRHGYEISKLIEQRSQGALRFHAASLYPLLYRLEKRGWLTSEWRESETGRDAKFYSLTRQGRRQLEAETANWTRLAGAIALILKASE